MKFQCPLLLLFVVSFASANWNIQCVLSFFLLFFCSLLKSFSTFFLYCPWLEDLVQCHIHYAQNPIHIRFSSCPLPCICSTPTSYPISSTSLVFAVLDTQYAFSPSPLQTEVHLYSSSNDSLAPLWVALTLIQILYPLHLLLFFPPSSLLSPHLQGAFSHTNTLLEPREHHILTSTSHLQPCSCRSCFQAWRT